MLKCNIVAVIPDNSDFLGNHTIYLFNKELRILLPIKIDKKAVETLAMAQSKNDELRPHVHDTMRRLISALNGQLESVIINGHKDDIFYSYIRIKQNKDTLDIDAKPSDSIAVAIRTNSPIYVRKNVIAKNGIKITNDFIIKSIY